MRAKKIRNFFQPTCFVLAVFALSGRTQAREMSKLDELADIYIAKVSSMASVTDCLPILVDQKDEVGIFYEYCSPEAQAAESQSVKLTDNFTVPEKLARRFHFWRRTYSLWSIDQYVLHSAMFPEVVLEVADVSRVDPQVGEKKRAKMAHKILMKNKAEFQALLMKLHKNRYKDPATYTPAMRRIAALMNHITGRDKYLLAAYSLRVQRGQHEFVAKGLANSVPYMPAIEDEFRKEGVPLECARLAFVESSFNLAAESKVGASGVYQLMEDTGRQYGLKISPWIDERNDPIKAAHVAAKLLAMGYRVTGNWGLAITSYNHGVNGIRHAVKKMGSDELSDLVEFYKGNAFGFASKNFYTEFLGMLATVNEAKRIFPEIPLANPLRFEVVKLKRAMDIAAVRKKYKLTLEDIRFYNHDIHPRFLRIGGLLPKGYSLKIPADQTVAVIEGKRSR